MVARGLLQEYFVNFFQTIFSNTEVNISELFTRIITVGRGLLKEYFVNFLSNYL